MVRKLHFVVRVSQVKQGRKRKPRLLNQHSCCITASLPVASLPSAREIPGARLNVKFSLKAETTLLHAKPSPDSSFHRQRPRFLLRLRRNTERLT